jgi:hypothetical protein
MTSSHLTRSFGGLRSFQKDGLAQIAAPLLLVIAFLAAFGCIERPVLPAIGVSPTTLNFAGTEGGANPASQTLRITNIGSGELNWTISGNAAWLTVTPTSGSTTTETDELTVSVNTAGLTAAGSPYEGEITVTDPNAVNSPRTVSVTLTLEAAPVQRSLAGRVESLSGGLLEGVLVTLSTGESTTTDKDGLFVFDALIAGETVVASFQMPGYAPTSKRFAVNEKNTPQLTNVVMAEVGAATTFDAAAGKTHRTAKSSVTVKPSSLVDSEGRPVTGNVNLRVTHFDPSTEEVWAFPGSFQDALSEAGQTVPLESFGFAYYELSQGGNKVNLAPGKTATIEYVLPDNSQGRFADGDTIPLWGLDEDKGRWVEAGVGQVRPASDGSGRLAWFADVDHFSWWNCDEPNEDKHCITGQVVFEDGQVPWLAVIRAPGVSYNGFSVVVADESTGAFCVNVKRGSLVRLEVYLCGVGGPRAEPDYQQVLSIPDVEATCGGGGCLNVGKIVILYDSCVSGRVVGDHVEGVAVHVEGGQTVLTGPDGVFCAKGRAPAGLAQPVVWATGFRPALVTMPVGATCAAGDCPVVLLSQGSGDVFVCPPDDPCCRIFNCGDCLRVGLCGWCVAVGCRNGSADGPEGRLCPTQWIWDSPGNCPPGQ